MDNCAYISRKISPGTAPLLNLLRRCDSGFLLESSLDIDRMGRYSFFGIEPFSVLQYKNGWITHSEKGKDKKFKGNIFNYLRGLLDNYKLAVKNPSANPPFLGGAVGFLSYDLGFYLENIPRKNIDDLNTPDLWFAFFDAALVIDHYKNEAIVFSSGFPEKGGRLRKIRAKQRLGEFIKQLDGLSGNLSLGQGYCPKEYELKSNFTHADYIKAINKSLDYITRGDIYQINLSQRFHAKTDLSQEELYANFKRAFPVPFAGMLKTKDFSIVCGSPERFIKYDGDFVVTRPMKGTRRRTGKLALDKRLRRELEDSAKDKAELLMIVDLERNDLGKVCDYGSIKVESLRSLEEYATVFQATSQVRGRLYPGMDRVDIIKACFPGGSITGCPKIRAMQIIEELEPNRRGIYTGSMGYFSFNGTMDFNILIRSFFKRGRDVYFGVGGGIVYDSKPELEYEETLVKAKALKMALKGYKNEALCVAG